MKHKKDIEKYNGSIKELSRDIINLDYGTLVELFSSIKEDVKIDANHDRQINHKKVANHLENISKALQEILEKDIQPLAKLCRPYNKKEQNKL